jgi:hypothetical protein
VYTQGTLKRTETPRQRYQYLPPLRKLTTPFGTWFVNMSDQSVLAEMTVRTADGKPWRVIEFLHTGALCFLSLTVSVLIVIHLTLLLG